MALDSAFLSELKYRCPIEEVIGSYIQLKRAGTRYVACCPFHSEKTPSFHVAPEKGFFHCFGCGAGGDVISFVMKQESLDYIDAVRLLAQRAGISMPEDSSVPDGKKRQRERMLEMHRLAARHFYKNLMSGDNAAMRYINERGLNIRSVKRYGLGFAADSFDDLKKVLLGAG